MTETDPAMMLVNSAEDIAYLLRWAKAHNIVLNQVHADIAHKYGVPTDGAIISGMVPTTRVLGRLALQPQGDIPGTAKEG